MKKLLACFMLLFIASIGYAYWHGAVGYKVGGGPVAGASVMAWPQGGSTTTDSEGQYTLDLDDGMEEGEYYDYLAAYKGIQNGRNYVERRYYDETNEGPFYIYIQIPEEE